MALFAVPMLLVMSFIFERAPVSLILDVPLDVALAMAYTSLCSTIIAYGLWYFLIQRYNVSQVAPYSLLVPVFGIIAGHIVYNEHLSWQIIGGGALTLLGVAIIVLRRPKIFSFGKPV